MNVVVTGASRGLGPFITRAFGARGTNLLISARASEELEQEGRALTALGFKCTVVAADLADGAAVETLAERALGHFGGAVDILVNNAGIETCALYEQLSIEDIDRTIAINVRAPMVLARRVLPGMLKRDQGHIVNVASLAGVGWVAHAESYVATKHALVGFTKALRASMRLRGTRVSASVVLPGFVANAGMYATNQARYGLRAPLAMGLTTPPKVANAVLRSVDRNLADVLVNPIPLRTFFALHGLFPRFAEWMSALLGVDAALSRIAEGRDTTTPLLKT
jgi:short-subunit dehydrogenase